MKKSASEDPSDPAFEARELRYSNQLLVTILELKKLQPGTSDRQEVSERVARILLERLSVSVVGFALRSDSGDQSDVCCFAPEGRIDSQQFKRVAEQSLAGGLRAPFEIDDISPQAETCRLLGPLHSGDQMRGILFLVGFERPSSDECPLIRELLEEVSSHLCCDDAPDDSVSSKFFENNHAMMLLVDPETGDIVDANPAAVRHYGWSREEMRGKPLSDVNTLSPLELRMAINDAAEGKRNLFSFQHRRADGSLSDVDILSGKILFGGRELLYSIVHDAGERRAAEESLAKERQRLQFILDAAEYGTWEWDFRANKATINETLARMIGCSSKELRPTTIEFWRAHCHPEDLEKSESLLRGCLSKESRLFECEMRLKHKEGHWVWALARGQVVTRDRYDNPLQMFGTLTSIQSRKNREAEREVLREHLMQSKKMESVGRLAGGIAHDSNNLLTVILGHAESALSDLGSEHSIADDLRGIVNAAQKLAQLTRQLLTFARRQPATPQLISIDDTIGNMIETLRARLGDQATLDWSPGVGEALVKLDPIQVNQVVDHLVSNAGDAVAEGGIITLTTTVKTLQGSPGPDAETKKPGEYVVVSVRDNGRGMEQATMARLYEPFFTTKEFGNGTGLGLSIVDGIINQNQGFIRVRSQVGKGTEFEVFLPVALGDKPVMEEPRARKRGDCTETILIVEDEPSVLLLAERILKRKGYQVLSAALPEIAIEVFKANKEAIDLVLTDVMMPGMNGPEMVRRLLEESPDLKCLYMSGYSAETIAERGLLDRTVHVVEKPFCVKGLSDKVRDLLDS